MAEAGYTIRAANGEVHVVGSRIVADPPPDAAVIAIPHAEIRPGLINAHDHLHRNHYGRLGNPPYADAYEWTRDIEANFKLEVAAGRALNRHTALLVGAWKNLFAGVTTVVHHDRWEEDLRAMPLHVVVPRHAHSLGLDPDFNGDGCGPFCIHLAEGTGPDMAAEIAALARRGLLDQNLLAVHCVGLDDEAVDAFRSSGAAVVWCPTSNHFLFGRTAPARLLSEVIDVLLGTDSLLTGAGDLLDELRLARSTGLVSDARLEAAVGAVAARRLGLPLPSIEPGARADLVVLAAPLLEASAADVELVVVSGVPRVAHPRWADRLEALGSAGRIITLRGLERWVCGEELNQAQPAQALTPRSREPA